MFKEIFIEIYLVITRILFLIFRFFPLQQNKITFLASFKENPLAIYEELNRIDYSGKIVFLCRKRCYYEIRKEVTAPMYFIETANLWHFLLSMYHLATSKYIIVDNYYGVLASTSFRKDVECIQIWHAGGAIKAFGLKDASIQDRSERAINRFKRVYEKFHKVVTGSSTFSKIFQEAFGLPKERMLQIGFPRTDFFYDKKKIFEAKQNIIKSFPELKDKKCILYAPTFRKKENGNIQLDIAKMYKYFKDEYVLLIRLHPTVSKKYNYNFDNFVYDFSNYPNINELLAVTDILITDYSSIPFEFALMEKPMIFYPYDLKKYEHEQGFWEPYEKAVPGPIAMSTDEIISMLLKNEFDLQKVKKFAKKWNEYTPGSSGNHFIHYLLSSSNIDHQKFTKINMPTSKELPFQKNL